MVKKAVSLASFDRGLMEAAELPAWLGLNGDMDRAISERLGL